jgi:hypothetical protein
MSLALAAFGLFVLSGFVPVLGFAAAPALLATLYLALHRWSAWRAYYRLTVGTLPDPTAYPDGLGRLLAAVPVRPEPVWVRDTEPVEPNRPDQPTLGKLDPQLREAFEAELVNRFRRLRLGRVVVGRGELVEWPDRLPCYFLETAYGRLGYGGFVYYLVQDGLLLSVKCKRIIGTWDRSAGWMAIAVSAAAGLVALGLELPLGFYGTAGTFLLIAVAAWVWSAVAGRKSGGEHKELPAAAITELNIVFDRELRQAWEKVRQIPLPASPPPPPPPAPARPAPVARREW